MEMFKRMMGRDGLRFADEGEATLALFAIQKNNNGPVWNLSPGERNSCRPYRLSKENEAKLAQASQEQPARPIAVRKKTILREAKANQLTISTEIKGAQCDHYAERTQDSI